MACLGKHAHMGHDGHGHCDQTKEGNLMGGLGLVLKFVYSVRQVYLCCQSSGSIPYYNVGFAYPLQKSTCYWLIEEIFADISGL